MRKPRSRLKGQKSQGWVEGVLGDGAGGVSGEDLGEGAHWGTGGPSLTPKLEGPSLGATPPPPPRPGPSGGDAAAVALFQAVSGGRQRRHGEACLPARRLPKGALFLPLLGVGTDTGLV